MKTTTLKATKTVYPIICQIVNAMPTQFIAASANLKEFSLRHCASAVPEARTRKQKLFRVAEATATTVGRLEQEEEGLK